MSPIFASANDRSTSIHQQGPVFGSRLVRVSEGSETMSLEHYQAGFKPLLYGVGLALVLTCFLKETGPAVRKLPVNP